MGALMTAPGAINLETDYRLTIRRNGYDPVPVLGKASYLGEWSSQIRVPDDVSLDILAAFPCGVNTGAGAVMHVLKPQPGDSYVAFGVRRESAL